MARPVRRGIRVMDMRRKCSRREEAPRLVRDAGRVQEHIRKLVADQVRSRRGRSVTTRPVNHIVTQTSRPMGTTPHILSRGGARTLCPAQRLTSAATERVAH